MALLRDVVEAVLSEITSGEPSSWNLPSHPWSSDRNILRWPQTSRGQTSRPKSRSGHLLLVFPKDFTSLRLGIENSIVVDGLKGFG